MGVAIGYAPFGSFLLSWHSLGKGSHILWQVDNMSSVAILPLRKFVDMISMTVEISISCQSLECIKMPQHMLVHAYSNIQLPKAPVAQDMDACRCYRSRLWGSSCLYCSRHTLYQ